MKEYNGFSPSERMSAWRLQKKAIANGSLVQTPCEMCTQTDGLLMPHLEDYTQPLTAFHWLCVECHMTLHGRFSNPVRWVKLLLKLRDGYICTPYHNVMSFFSISGFDKEKPPEYVINSDVWHERLPMSVVNFRELSDDEKDYIR